MGAYLSQAVCSQPQTQTQPVSTAIILGRETRHDAAFSVEHLTCLTKSENVRPTLYITRFYTYILFEQLCAGHVDSTLWQ